MSCILDTYIKANSRLKRWPARNKDLNFNTTDGNERGFRKRDPIPSRETAAVLRKMAEGVMKDTSDYESDSTPLFQRLSLGPPPPQLALQSSQYQGIGFSTLRFDSLLIQLNLLVPFKNEQLSMTTHPEPMSQDFDIKVVVGVTTVAVICVSFYTVFFVNYSFPVY